MIRDMDIDDNEAFSTTNILKTSALTECNKIFVKYKLHLEYELISATGPAHTPNFKYKVSVYDTNHSLLGEAIGNCYSKKTAKAVAVMNFLSKLAQQELTPDACTTSIKMYKSISSTTLETNAVGFLQEYCMKNKLDPPIYQETPKDDFGEFGFSCTFENFSAIGYGKCKKEAKKKSARLVFEAIENNKAADPLREIIESFKQILQHHKNDTSYPELPAMKPPTVPMSVDVVENSIEPMPVFVKLSPSNAQETTSKVSTMEDLTLDNHGVAVLSDVISGRASKKLIQVITRDIQRLAAEIPCTVDEYLASVNCWEPPSSLSGLLAQWVISAFYPKLKLLFGHNLKEPKTIVMNVINTNVPCHQDIAYSQDSPYEFGVFLPLHFNEKQYNDSDEDEFLFEFLPCSHKSNVSSPVDYHEPNYRDTKRETSEWNSNALLISPLAHQAILFDSRVWYRFEGKRSESKPPQTSFVLKMNWKRTDFVITNDYRCAKDTGYGIWTNQYFLTSILQQGLVYCYQKFKPHNFKDCLKAWICALMEKNDEHSLIEINRERVLMALQKVWIHNLARERHGGSDIDGKISSMLWKEFLFQLSQRLNLTLSEKDQITMETDNLN